MIHYHDGEKVTLSSDRAQLRQEVEKWEGPGGGEKLDAFLAYVHSFSLCLWSMKQGTLTTQGRSITRFPLVLSRAKQGIPHSILITPTRLSEELFQSTRPG